MELYTIGIETGYPRQEIIDEYESLVWTERWQEAGEMQLVIPANYHNAVLTRPGGLMGVDTSRELMLMTTRSIKDGVITAQGFTLEKFFANRFTPLDKVLFEGDPGDVALGIVNSVLTIPGAEQIPGLRTALTGAYTGATYKRRLAHVEVYATLVELCKQYGFGMSINWHPLGNVDNDHELVFETYEGNDKRSQVFFSPNLDNFANISEVLSVDGSKSIVFVYPPPDLTKTGELAHDMEPIYVSNIPFDDLGNPFARRVGEITASYTKDDLEGTTDADKLDDLRDKMYEDARNELAKNKKQKLVDGEIVPGQGYTYYTDATGNIGGSYRLGDKVKVEGNFTDPIDAVITELIQSSDATGSRSYPTLAVPVDPELTGDT